MLNGKLSTFIGEDLLVQGELRSPGIVELKGRVEGMLSASRVIIHPGGRLLGILKADNAEVAGHLQGNVAVKQLLSISGSGVVLGDVRYGMIALAEGGELSGEMRNIPPEISGDFEVVVRRGRAVAITVSDISAYDPDDAAANLQFTVTRPANGFLARASAPRSAIESFTQAELLAGNIMFAHDGSDGARASFEVVVIDKSGATSGAPRAVQVSVV